jgi:uncharacterized protein
MKILIDIGHPGHVHYFRNFIKKMEKKGHEFKVIARDKEVTFKLLDFYKIPYNQRGKGGKGFIGKVLYILIADFRIFKCAIKFKPDILLSFSSTYAGHVAFILNKPHIVFDDTEHAKYEHLMYKPFAQAIVTPACFYKNMGKKQITFNGYMELCYLHKNYYKPSPDILNLLKVHKNEQYAIVRFVSWEAGHDIGHNGLDLNLKIQIINELKKHFKVFISSESSLPSQLEEYRLYIPAERLHDALKYSSLYIGEGGTTASEAVMLGVPALYINSLPLMGYLRDEENAGMLFHLKSSEKLLSKMIEIINSKILVQSFNDRYNKFIDDKIDVTAFMVWFVENYPESKLILRNQPGYQNNFKQPLCT